MNSLAEFVSVLWLTAALSFFLYSSRQKRREKGMMEALRRSALYLRLYRKLDHLFHHYEIDQLRVEQNGVTDCARCHGFESWDASHFDHTKTAFPLEGKHAQVACEKCHKPSIVNGETLVQYKLERFECIDCHQ